MKSALPAAPPAAWADALAPTVTAPPAWRWLGSRVGAQYAVPTRLQHKFANGKRLFIVIDAKDGLAWPHKLPFYPAQRGRAAPGHTIRVRLPKGFAVAADRPRAMENTAAPSALRSGLRKCISPPRTAVPLSSGRIGAQLRRAESGTGMVASAPRVDMGPGLPATACRKCRTATSHDELPARSVLCHRG